MHRSGQSILARAAPRLAQRGRQTFKSDYTSSLASQLNSSSTRKSSTNNKTSKTFWSPRVVFGGANENDWSVQQGAIRINSNNGFIEKCLPGVSRDQARSESWCSASEFVDLSKLVASEAADATTCLSPGLVDVHTHISTLGRNWEGYGTATQAAAAGGITTIIGMPLNSLPPTVSVVEVELELQHALQESSGLYVDVGLWGGVLPETATNIEQLTNLLSHPNVLGLKAFLSPLPDGAGYQAITPEQLLEVAKLCGSFDKPILVHSELMTVAEQEAVASQCYPSDGSQDDSHLAHVQSRATRWEQDAVRVVIDAAQHCDMHVVHLSDGLGCLPLIEQAKASLLGISRRRLTVETCPHYLLLDTDQIAGDNRVKCFPPIRESAQRRRLWEGLISGMIDMIASDHSPCEPFMRRTSMKAAWGGLSGLQYQLPATWTAAQRIMEESPTSSGKDASVAVTEKEMAHWWSYRPAGLSGLKDRGSIEPGKRADFVLWDTSFVGPPDSYAKEYHRWKGDSYYASQDLCGRVLGTWLVGKQIYDGINDCLLLADQGSYIQK